MVLHKDPFDKVLEKLQLLERIQEVDPIDTADMPAIQHVTTEVPCRIRGMSELSIEQREELALKIIKFVHPTAVTATRIRPISLRLDSDGNLQAEPVHMVHPRLPPGVYRARYGIPMSTIDSLPVEEQVWRVEKFALGSLLYKVLTGHSVFEGQTDADIQEHFSTASTFPDLEGLPPVFQCVIYACWSAEFGRHITLARFTQYVEDHPGRFALQVTGAVIGTAAFITVPILGAVGFTAIGPAAGSIAAGWQAAIGAVEAGSLFAFCQSAAMGGAAAAGLAGTGAAGTVVALGASASALPISPSSLRDTFIRKFRAPLPTSRKTIA